MITHQAIKKWKKNEIKRNGVCIISANIESLSLKDIIQGYKMFSLEVLQIVLLTFDCGFES